uniref:Uncharacterized protein n=1 Tax=Arundo donax TaxID=35708 RepID=A0A0A9A8A9_ARUDO
MSALSWCTV